MVGGLAVYQSSIGKKVLMAITGLIMTGFVFIHMIGNLKIYLPDQGAHLNHYGEYLRELGSPILVHGQALWMFRIVLLTALVVHVLSALQLWGMANAARSNPYDKKKADVAVYLGMMMRLGGIVIGMFIAIHVLHLTVGMHPQFIHGEVYHNVVTAFQQPVIALLYAVAMIPLGVHIWHGGWSLFQTLGLNNRRWQKFWKTVAALIAILVVVGNISFPLSVLIGFVK
jgi:succinate dehydrogenase / fumarate reductase cytochrome b subunit